MSKALLLLIGVVTVLTFQNCGGGLSSNRSSLTQANNFVDLSGANISVAPVDYQVVYDPQTLLISGPTSDSTNTISADQLMAKFKYKACMFNSLLSENIEDFDEYLALLGRSACEALPRSVETWNLPPNWSLIRNKINSVTSRTGKKYFYGMFIAESISTKAHYLDDNGQAFDFKLMCKEGSHGFWGTDTCVPEVGRPEYNRYLKFIVRKAIENGVSDILFGQTGHQDPHYRLGQFISELRQIALSLNKPLIIGQQPNGRQPEVYLRAFDYVISPTYVDKDVSKACWPGVTTGCQAVLFHPEFLAQTNNVIAEFDWGSLPTDDIHYFAAKPTSVRHEYLESQVAGHWSKGVGFVMPFRIVMSGDKSGKFCYGFNEWVYSSNNKYGCKDEDVINRLLRGNFKSAPAPQEPVLSRNQALQIVKDAYKTILERTDAENAKDTKGIDYWAGRMQAGLTYEELIEHLKNSDEYFLRGAYKTYLKRAADAAGLDFYMSELANGKTRAQIIADMDYICKKALNGECPHNKTPAPPVTPVPAPTPIVSQPLPVSDAQLNSIISKAYSEILFRSADSNDLAYWRGQMRNGLTESGLRSHLNASDEKFVRDAYISWLRRVPQVSEIQYYVNELKANRITRAKIVEHFKYVCQNKISGECK